MSRFTSSLHPRDRNGKFTNKAGGNKSKRKRTVPKPRYNTIAANFKAAATKASTPSTPKQISRANTRAQRDIKVARVANTAAHSYASASAAQQSGAIIATAITASAAGAGTPLLAVMGAKATIKGAKAINEAHRVRSINSRKYREGTIEERSKFDAAYGKRDKVISRADTATTVVGILHIASTPLIRERAATQNYRRAQQASAYTGGSSLAKRDGTNAKPKLAKQRRNGVYDITTAGGKRVA